MSARRVRRLGLAALLLALVAKATLALVLRAVPLVDPARFARPELGLTVTDRDGAPLRRVRGDASDRRWVPLAEVPPVLVQAVLAAEDKRFFSHDGVDRVALVRALLQNLTPFAGHSGASTLTQQLVKRVYGRPHRLLGKPLEMLRALALERVFTKEEILEQYLNRVPYGDGIEGVARASELYLGTDVRALSAAQAALLAGIPQAPSALHPLRHPERARARRDRVLARMHALGALDDEGYARALREPLRAGAPGRTRIHAYEAPRYVDAALVAYRAGALRRDGDAVRTSLSLPLQHRVESSLEHAVDALRPRGVTNGAALLVSVHDGSVLAYAASARSEGEGAALDLLRAERSSGSTLKPFVYERWFERGESPGSVVYDVARPLLGARGGELELQNYDHREHGIVSARVALASSYNLAALDVARRVGVDALHARLRSLGFSLGDDASVYGPGVALGATVSAWQLAGAYATLARGGHEIPLRFSTGPLRTYEPRRVLDDASSQMVTDVLSDGATRARAFGASLEERAGGAPFALKTGTSQRARDLWAVAYDARFVVVVWMGDPLGRPTEGLSGFAAAAPVAATLLGQARATLAGWPAALRVTVPEETVLLCPFTGLRAGPRCPHRVLTRVARGHAPRGAPCGQHAADGTFLVPESLRAWVERAHPAEIRLDDRGVHTRAHGDGGVDEAPRVIAPANHTRIFLERARDAPVVTLRASGDGMVEWLVDGALIDGARWAVTSGAHTIIARRGDRMSDPVQVRVERAGP